MLQIRDALYLRQFPSLFKWPRLCWRWLTKLYLANRVLRRLSSNRIFLEPTATDPNTCIDDKILPQAFRQPADSHGHYYYDSTRVYVYTVTVRRNMGWHPHVMYTVRLISRCSKLLPAARGWPAVCYVLVDAPLGGSSHRPMLHF